MPAFASFLMRRPTWQLFAFAAVLVGIVYWPSTRYDFVGLDDPEYITENEHVLTGLSRSNLVWAVTSVGYADNWHPLAWISLQGDASLARTKGGQPDMHRLSGVMHAHNVTLHVMNAVLLMALILLVTGNRWAALFFALLWAIHPLRTEIVCWATERKELVCVLFMLLTLLARLAGQGQRPKIVFFAYPLSLLFYGFALAAKPLAVTLPCLIFAWDWVVRRERWSRCALRTCPFLVLSGVASALTLAAQSEAVAIGNKFSLLQRVVMTLNAPIIYLRQTLWPTKLASSYPLNPPLHLPETVLGVVLVAFMAWVCVRWFRRRERWTAACVIGIAWGYIGLVPMLGIVKVGDQSHSDRYTYWVGCGVAAFVAWGVARLWKSERRVRVWRTEWGDWITVAALGCLALSTALTRMQMSVWKNRLTHYRNGALTWWAEAPVCCYARTLLQQEKPDREGAVRVLRQALKHNDMAAIRAELAYVTACHCKPTPLWNDRDGLDPAFLEAKSDAELAIRLDAKSWRGYEALGIVYLRNAKYDLAMSNLTRARELVVVRKDDSNEVGNIDMLLDLCKRQADEKR